MGANYVSFNSRGTESEVRRAFEIEQEQDRFENGHSYSGGIGMARGLAFKSNVFQSDKEADTWLMDHAQKWEAAIAVIVREGDCKSHFRIGAWCSC